MKQVNIFLLLMILFAACSPQTMVTSTSIVAPTSVLSQTSTIVSTATLTPTTTPTLIPTATIATPPSLPLEQYATSLGITIIRKGEIPDEYIRYALDAGWAVQKYLCDLYELCKFPPANLVIGDQVFDGSCGSGYFDGYSGLTLLEDMLDCKGGLKSVKDDPSKTVEQVYKERVARVQVNDSMAHEFIHLYVQWGQGSTQREINKFHYDWTEGPAQRLYGEALAYIGLPMQYKNHISYSNLPCDIWENLNVAKAIAGNVEGEDHNKTIIGWYMMDYLIKNHGGVPNLIKVWAIAGSDHSKSRRDIILDVYGVTEEELYGTVIPLIPTDCAEVGVQNNSMGISGTLIWNTSFPKSGTDQYMLNFCPITNGNCLGATHIQSDGSFMQPLASGYYYISLNYKDGGPPIGWYSINGMVMENGCGEIVNVSDQEITKIDFKVASPISCESLEPESTPTLQPTTGISGKIIWDSSYPNQGLDKYILNFCQIKGGNCQGATPIQLDGTFIQSLPSGYYWVNLNLKEGGTQPLGWYSSKGMVKENNCARLVQVTENVIVKIDFAVNSPIPCN